MLDRALRRAAKLTPRRRFPSRCCLNAARGTRPRPIAGHAERQQDMTVITRAEASTVDALEQALVGNALAGELDGFSAEEQEEAARFIAEVALQAAQGRSRPSASNRPAARPAAAACGWASSMTTCPSWSIRSPMRSPAVTSPSIDCCTRWSASIATTSGVLQALEPLCDDKSRRESMMYIELDRADARGRRELVDDLHAVLGDVRAAVRDWPQDAGADARRRRQDRGSGRRRLLNWFADGALTLLGYEVERPGRGSVQCAGHLLDSRRADRQGRLGRRDPLFRGRAAPSR